MRSLMVLATLVVVSSPLSAQRHERNPRHGFWAGAGLAAGSIGTECTGCTDNRIYGPAGYIRLGGTLSRSWLLGAEISGWSLQDRGVDQGVAAAMVDLFWYPSARGAFYFKFGGGALEYRRQAIVLGSLNETRETAPALTLGMGYDIRVSRNLSLVPFANAYGSSAVRRTVNGTQVVTNGDVHRDMVQAGIGITLH